MTQLRYFLSLFLRRLHFFLLVAVILGAVSVTVATTLPAAYVSQSRLMLEAPQIPAELASSTVVTAPVEQMQIIEQRLMTRANLLDIARRLEALDGINRMSPDEIVRAMRARTTIRYATGRNAAMIMTMSFEATDPRKAAEVLNEYITIIQRQNAEFRAARAGGTLEFFEQEVARLGADLDRQSARILEFKTRNSDALPETLSFRLSRQTALQERIAQLGRDISTLSSQRDRLVQMFEATGRLGPARQTPQTPEERQLERLQQELATALLTFSEENPRVTALRARIAQQEELVRAQTGAAPGMPGEATLLDIQLAEIDTRLELLREQRDNAESQLAELTATIDRTPANAIALDELERVHRNLASQYNTAVDRLARASTGDRIEAMARGQRIVVIEPPAVPNAPTKPNRLLIAGGGSLAGVLAGIGLVVLLELLNRSIRRPEQLVARLGIQPLSTIPYIRSGNELVWKRLLKGAIILAIIIGIPAAVYAVHVHYLPLDLLAERAMNRIGMRW